MKIEIWIIIIVIVILVIALILTNIPARRLKRKVRKCLKSGGMYDHLLDKCVYKEATLG